MLSIIVRFLKTVHRNSCLWVTERKFTIFAWSAIGYTVIFGIVIHFFSDAKDLQLSLFWIMVALIVAIIYLKTVLMYSQFGVLEIQLIYELSIFQDPEVLFADAYQYYNKEELGQIRKEIDS